MCTRYTVRDLEAALRAVAKELGIDLGAAGPASPRYNVAPSQIVSAVALAGGRPGVRPMRWGFMPPADRALPKPRLLTNCRAETMTELPAFRAAAAARRCVVPADGFFEFKVVGKGREPYLFTRRDGAPLALAGLWEPAGEEAPETFCILTTEPNATTQPIHNRMPVLLTGPAVGQWLGDQPLDDSRRAELIRPAPADLLTLRPVNRYVNNSRHEGPECIADPEPGLPELV
jgi:putative SOS response-associated peptidase YedK